MRNLVRGFTLIEILVVLVIMGLMAGAMVMIGSDNREAIARDEIEQLNAKLKIALEEAQLYGTEYGLVVAETEYQFVRFEEERWTPISDDPAYRRHRLPDGFELALEIEGFKLPGARLPGARITEDGEVVVDESGNDDNRRPGTERNADTGDDRSPDATSPAPKAATADAASRPDDDEKEDAAKLLPQLFLLSSGELNPFVLAIGNREQDPVFYRLRATVDGDIKMEGPIRADPVDDLTIEWQNPDPQAEAAAETQAEDMVGRDRDRLFDDERKPRERKPAAGARDGGK